VSRIGNCVVVSGKDLVMEVLLDADELYSVSGYAERMRQSFGEIYLGLDAGPAYRAQSDRVNRAIGAISERQAFTLAFDETRRVLQPLANPAAFDIGRVSVGVLAGLCKVWFDLPDEVTIFTGGDPDMTPPARCPGDFSAPSGYIFVSEQVGSLTSAGQQLGHVLKDAAAKFVAGHRASRSRPKGVLSRAAFRTFPPASGHDDLLASTIIGVMVGMLPTVEGNLIAAVDTWQTDGTFAALQKAFTANRKADAYRRACATLKTPLMHAMQAAPVPVSVWRTAVRDHALGSVAVKAGDTVKVDIASATTEDLSRNVTDVCPVFGGDRRRVPHPTHACPGYAMAMGVMLGVIAALMSTPPAPAGQLQ
jgi:hypothetical protein